MQSRGLFERNQVKGINPSSVRVDKKKYLETLIVLVQTRSDTSI